MRRYRITLAFAIVSGLATVIFPLMLYAQQSGKSTDFRGRSDYTPEELGRALFPPTPTFRGQGAKPPPEKASVTVNVFFETNSDKILQRYYGDLDKLGKVLADHPGYRIEIDGHTDSIGSDRYNLLLSEKRAESVKQYLVQKFSIAPEQLVVKGYGKTKYIATNDTPEGRSKNRRIEVVNLGK